LPSVEPRRDGRIFSASPFSNPYLTHASLPSGMEDPSAFPLFSPPGVPFFMTFYEQRHPSPSLYRSPAFPFATSLYLLSSSIPLRPWKVLELFASPTLNTSTLELFHEFPAAPASGGAHTGACLSLIFHSLFLFQRSSFASVFIFPFFKSPRILADFLELASEAPPPDPPEARHSITSPPFADFDGSL